MVRNILTRLDISYCLDSKRPFVHWGRGTPKRVSLVAPVGLGVWVIVGVVAALFFIAQTARAQDFPWKQLAREPAIEVVQRAATARLNVVHLRHLVTRSRWASVVPGKVAFQVRRYRDTEWRGTYNDEDEWSRRTGQDARTSWRVDVEWDLSRLVYHPETLAISRALVAENRRSDQVVEEVTRLYFARRRLQFKYLMGQTPNAQRAGLWLRVAELTAQIDALTNGVLKHANIQWWQAQAPP